MSPIRMMYTDAGWATLVVTLLLAFISFYYASRQKWWLYLTGVVFLLLAGSIIGAEVERRWSPQQDTNEAIRKGIGLGLQTATAQQATSAALATRPPAPVQTTQLVTITQVVTPTPGPTSLPTDIPPTPTERVVEVTRIVEATRIVVITSTPPPPAAALENDVQPTPTTGSFVAELDDVRYELVGAILKGDKVTFTFEAENDGPRKGVCITSDSSMLDANGDPHTSIGRASGEKSVSDASTCLNIDLPTGVRPRFSVAFNAPPDTTSVQHVSITIYPEGSLEYVNVPVPYPPPQG